MKKLLVLFLSIVCLVPIAEAKKKTVIVSPETAKIYLNGAEVGTGSYVIDFKKDMDFVILKFEADGYVTKKNVRLLKDDPRKTVSYTLQEDEAYANSVGLDEGVDIANKWSSVNAKPSLSEDELWKRLVSIAVNNFENVDVRDKSAGWIRTNWVVRRFASGYTVRTRLEIRVQFTGEDERSFRCRVESQIADNDCRGSDNCFREYPRVLKKYANVISELQTTLGSNF